MQLLVYNVRNRVCLGVCGNIPTLCLGISDLDERICTFTAEGTVEELYVVLVVVVGEGL